MSEAKSNGTLNRIQREIIEGLRREEELKEEYTRARTLSPIRKPSQSSTIVNGRHFAPNPATRGLMHKFIKSRGRIGALAALNKPMMMAPVAMSTSSTWNQQDMELGPPRISLEAGKAPRNGFVPAEEKMRKELQEFQRREAELRKERRKSQPNLMAALSAEEDENSLKPARSMALMYSCEDLTRDSYSAPASLKPARSLAELCDASDDELEAPGTHSLILQFENMKKQARA